MSVGNPYQAPDEVSNYQEPNSSQPSQSNWKSIAIRWEKLRILYNLLILFPGVLAMTLASARGKPAFADILIAAVIYAVACNVMYLLGPITEMYLNWFAEVGGKKGFLPLFLIQLLQSWAVTAIIFLLGTGIAVFPTLIIILASMGHMLPDQM